MVRGELSKVLFVQLLNADADHSVITRLAICYEQLVQLEVNGNTVFVLALLDEKNHQESNDGCARVDHELPVLREMEGGSGVPRYESSAMPHEYAHRIVEGARHLSPHLGDRMAAARLLDRSVFVRELLPEDLKLEIAHISADEARSTARFLARVVGKAHLRQMNAAQRAEWRAALKPNLGESLDAPSWLWNSAVDLVGTHERGHLDHCRRYALETSKIREIRKQPQ